MKPTKIVIQAFGSYLEKAEIDFTKLFKYGIFLITGATGCGKTTILDAMSYALYGHASGSLRDVRDMRNTAAPDELNTFVSFEMELGSDLYKFERSMAIRVIKKRSGESERTVDNEESCYVFEGDKWRLLCTGTQVKDKAVELLGFSHEQFSQVVVLPQGEFRRLLTASSLDKQNILETLFGTARWKSFSKALAQRAKALDAELSQCVERSAALCSSVECENTEELFARLEKASQELDTVESGMKLLVEAFNGASSALLDADAIEKKFKELETAREKLKQLALETEKINEKRQSLDLAEKAAGMAPYLDALGQAQKALDAANNSEKLARSGLDAAQKAERQAQKALDDCADGDVRLKELAGETARLEGVLAPARALCAANAELEEMQKVQNAAGEAAQKEAARVERLSASCEDLKKRIKENYDRYVARLPELMSKKAELEACVDAFKKFDTQKKAVGVLSHALEAKRGEYKALLQSYKNEKQIYEKMQEAINSDAAYSLAGQLRDGCECPVCGSTLHPRPAAAASGAPSKDEIETQKSIIGQLEEKQKQSAEEGARIHGEHDAAAKRLGELETECKKFDYSKEEASFQLAEASKAVAEAQQAAKRQQAMETEQKTVEQTLLNTRVRFEELKTQADKAALEASALIGRVAQLSDTVPDNMRDAITIEARISTIKKQYDDISKQMKDARASFESACSALAAAVERLHFATDAKTDAEKSCVTAKNDYEQQLLKTGLPQDAAIRGFILTKEQRDGIRIEIEGFERENYLQKDRAASLEKQLSGSACPDMQSLREREAKARQEMEQALSQKGAFEARVKNLAGVRAQLSETAVREKKLRNDFALYDHIYSLTNGENPLKTPIHQFVLGLMLDDIVAAANVHLSQLSRGRYTLVRSVAPTRGGGTKGLDLSVGDGWSGGERAVSTLSGGEMFLASLSLAFGLSDVVQSYAGGIRLDSLFIDEGFGSLDAETLDTAMGALERIRLSGRLIGVISHVGDLCERIPAHIEVKKLSDGTAAADIRIP